MKFKQAYTAAKDKITMRAIEKLLKAARKQEQKMINDVLKLQHNGK